MTFRRYVHLVKCKIYLVKILLLVGKTDGMAWANAQLAPPVVKFDIILPD